jgi:hypothetical protein
MSSLLALVLLTITQLLAGWGLVTLFRIRLQPAFILPVSLIMGVAVFSVVPFILQLLYIPVTAINVFASLLLVTLALNIQFSAGIQMLRTTLPGTRFRIQLYEWPFLLVIVLLIFVSIWRCFYFPPTPADVTTGAEAIAEYAVREKTMINSVFELTQNGNTLKPPFITSLQIIYKYAGFPFGQLWLSSVFISFIVILYHALSATLHRSIVGLLMIFFLAIPEMYAYTFMILYDYSNAVFFFLAVFFLVRYCNNRRFNELAFAGLLLGIATYTRPETLLLTGCLLPVIIWNNIRNKVRFVRLASGLVAFAAPTVLFYLVAVYIYIHYYLPEPYSIAAQVNPALTNMRLAWKQFSETNISLIFSSQGIEYYSYFIFIFLGLLIAELFIKLTLTATAKNYLYAVLVIYLLYPLLSHVLPGVSIDNTVKRAFFKLFPLMLLYMANNSLVMAFSKKIQHWEHLPKV